MPFAFAAQPALGWWLGVWVPAACGDPLHTSLWGSPCPKLLVLQGKTTICPQGHGVTEEEVHQLDWTVHGELQADFGKSEGVGSKKSLKEGRRFATGGRDLGVEMAAASKLCLMSILSKRWCVWFDLWLRSKGFRQTLSEIYAGLFCWSHIHLFPKW